MILPGRMDGDVRKPILTAALMETQGDAVRLKTVGVAATYLGFDSLSLPSARGSRYQARLVRAFTSCGFQSTTSISLNNMATGSGTGSPSQAHRLDVRSLTPRKRAAPAWDRPKLAIAERYSDLFISWLIP